jgi:hypothetical protein
LDRTQLLAESVHPGEALAHRRAAIRFEADLPCSIQFTNVAAERLGRHGIKSSYPDLDDFRPAAWATAAIRKSIAGRRWLPFGASASALDL